MNRMPEVHATRPASAALTCAVRDLIPGAGVAAMLDGRQVAVFYLPGESPEIRALGNHDPLGSANVLARGIVGDVAGEPVVASPLYKHHFSLDTGRCLEQPDAAVPVYRVLVSDGYVYLIR